jgi:hypothetical protein
MSCLKLFTHSYHRVYKKAASRSIEYLIFRKIGGMYQGRIRDFKLGGAHLKKLRRAEGGAKIVGVFRVKNHDLRQKIIFFPILGPPLDPPLCTKQCTVGSSTHTLKLT